VCFPSAGAGASVFARWGEHLPPDVDLCTLQLPGREVRRREASLTDIHDIADRCLPWIEPLLDLPFAFFGHSMGAVIAFEVTRRLRERGHEPIALFVSGRGAPHVVRGSVEIEQLTDDEFISEMDRVYGGVPELLKTDMEFRELYLPPLRADVTAVARYRSLPTPPLTTPIHVLGGANDRSVTREALDAWASYAGGDFKVHVFPGDHFYLYAAREPVIALVSGELAHAGERERKAGLGD
jgi:surfactin synthase thioesterase subunit